MQFSMVGADAQGRSTVVSVKSVEFPHDPQGLAVETLWAMAAEEIKAAPPHAKDSHWMDLGLADGALRWVMWRLPPGSTSQMHHTDTIDCQVILAGEVTCELGAGEVRLRPGDAILIPGLEHKWVASSEGCTLAGVCRGLPARPPA